MSRRGRRAAGAGGRRAAGRSRGSGDDGRPLLAQAFELHRAGDLTAALRLYRRALKAEPANPDAHLLTGIALHHSGDPAGALPRLDEALARRPGDATAHNHRAEVLAALGRLEEAEAELRGLLAVEPKGPHALNNLANVLMETGRLDEAVDCYRKAIDAAPDFAEAHGNLGAALARQGKLVEAHAACERALELRPEHGEAHFNLGNVLAEQGRVGEAAGCFEQARALMPDDHRAALALGQALAALGRGELALDALAAALDAAPDDAEAWAAAARALAGLPDDAMSEAAARLIERCLRSDLVEPETIGAAAGRALRWRHGLPDGAQAAADWPVPDDLAARLGSDALAVALLARAVNTDPALEAVLVRLRRALLDGAADGAGLAFTVALARQCFLNEFVFAETDAEAAAADALGAAVEARVGAADFPDDADQSALARYALYRPLSRLPAAEALAARPIGSWRGPLRPLVEAELVDWLEERSIAADLPAIGAIEDPVSRVVAAQYEDNPYPRWAAVAPGQPESLAGVFARHFPLKPVPEVLDGPVDILVAGCGTGRHPIASVALRYRDAEVLAIDLSGASLAYAARKAAEAGVANIAFAQADILGLSALDRHFHVIECAGVLHHMADPAAGWRVLRDLLVPGGVMIVGLYSERARAAVVAARARIADLGLDATPEGIRAFRRRLLAGAEDKALAGLLGWPDFYSLSGARDLLFHAEEHRFTLPQIAALLDELKLEFLGFEDDRPAFWRRYRAHAPDDPAATDLAAWDRLEARQPDLFAGMYQFWCRRTDR